MIPLTEYLIQYEGEVVGPRHGGIVRYLDAHCDKEIEKQARWLLDAGFRFTITARASGDDLTCDRDQQGYDLLAQELCRDRSELQAAISRLVANAYAAGHERLERAIPKYGR